MIKIFFQFLREINDHYANVLLVLIAFISLVYAYNQYVINLRPYVLPEIVFEQKDTNWYFNILLVNKGEKPGIARITKALLKIGDEEYPTIFKTDIVLSPQEKQTLAPIGFINETGRKKIMGNGYKNNKVEIFIEIESKAIGSQDYNYKTRYEYMVDVSGSLPVFQLVNGDLL